MWKSRRRKHVLYRLVEQDRWYHRLRRPRSASSRHRDPVDEPWYGDDDWLAEPAIAPPRALDPVPQHAPTPRYAPAPQHAAVPLAPVGPRAPELELERAPRREAGQEDGRMPYLPALDGLRAIALVSVLAFHSGFSWIHGGYLPLTSFFVLSGFLITSLLLLEQGRNGRISLGSFWGRRARRLVPAALLALALVGVYTASIHRPTPGLRLDVLACLGWFANWRFIFAGRSYADLFGDPSPVQHFWSLAVEEQFYLVLPPLAVGLLWLARGKRWLLGTVTAGLVAASTIWMAYLHEPGEAPLRSYFGTDTRAAELLVGVLLALALTKRKGLRRFSGPGRWALEVAGAAALGVSVWLWFVTKEYDDQLYEGGLLGIALLAAVMIAAATQPGSLVSRVLGLRPLAALGRISYGVYLFHWPLFLWIDEERTGLDGGPLFGLRMAVTLLLAIASYHLVEQPIRTGIRRRPRVLLTGWANATVAAMAFIVLVSSSSAAPAVTVQTADGPAPEVVRGPQRTSATGGAGSSTSSSLGTTSSNVAPTSTMVIRGRTAGASGSSGSSTTGRTSTTSGSKPHTTNTTSPPVTAPAGPLKVMVVGDSLAVNLGTGLSLHTQQHGGMEVLNFAANGCPVTGDSGMRYPNGQLHVPQGTCDSRKAQWAGQLDSFDPDIVLVESSIFDILDRTQLAWGGSFYHVGDPTFDAWLLQQERNVVSLLRSRGAKVVWANVPCAHFDPTQHPNHHSDEEGNRRINVLNANVITRLGVPVADFRGHVCPGGRYSSTVDGVAGARFDGVHFTDAGAKAVADRWLAPLLLSMR